MSQRPSKRAMYRYLKRDMARRPGGVGVDAASANMKNYWMFKTDQYVGVDVNLDLLRQGLGNKPHAIGVLADLAHLNFPENCADLCVSTNTFEHLRPSDQVLMAGHLTRIVKPDGAFLFNKHCDSAYPSILELVRREFAEVEVIHYRNYLSHLYEVAFEGKNPFLEKWTVAVLSWLENVTAFIPWFNKAVYVRCTRKHRYGPDHSWNVESLERIDDNLYQCR